MSYVIRYSAAARADIVRHYAYLLEFDDGVAVRAVAAIEKSIDVLETFPFACRKASVETPFLRELVIPFGSAGYVALFEIEDGEVVTILAVRHQREDDYH